MECKRPGCGKQLTQEQAHRRCVYCGDECRVIAMRTRPSLNRPGGVVDPAKHDSTAADASQRRALIRWAAQWRGRAEEDYRAWKERGR